MALEGELTETGLTNLAADDPLIALARSLLSNDNEIRVFTPPQDWEPAYIAQPVISSVQVLKPVNITAGLYTLEKEIKQHHAKKSMMQRGDFMLFPPEEMRLEIA